MGGEPTLCCISASLWAFLLLPHILFETSHSAYSSWESVELQTVKEERKKKRNK